MAIDTEHFKEKLEKEKAELEAQLSQVARKDPNNPSNWEPKPNERDVSSADENTVADGIEEYEENNAITNALEARYKDVMSGLDKIKHGVYGKCQICQKEIEEDRLEANPAARTCKEHINSL
ncbi:TraR/DksA C4-type zinc finger protein [Candidatus Parcubacteria bacterium]|nr:TraR/DksA C4-type zinc finger protein [Candidatus Parcubacteria bacterium]